LHAEDTFRAALRDPKSSTANEIGGSEKRAAFYNYYFSTALNEPSG
jgi:hypothetical protein